VRFNLSCDFTEFGLEGFAASTSWVYGDTPDSGAAASPDQQEFDLNLDYRPSVKWLDNFWLRVRYGINDREFDHGGIDREDFRVILNYSFLF